MSDEWQRSVIPVTAKADDAAGGNSTRDDDESSAEEEPREMMHFDIDLALFVGWRPDSLGEDEKDAAKREAHIHQQISYFLDLLADPVTCFARTEFLRSSMASPEGRELFPEGYSQDMDEFLGEFVWIATGCLREAVLSGLSSLERLGEIAGNPDWLWRARLVFGEGLDVNELRIAMDRRYLATTDWLREEAMSGRLVAALGPGILGKYVAAWKPYTRPEDMAIADRPLEARKQLAAQWMVPLNMISELRIDSDSDYRPEAAGDNGDDQTKQDDKLPIVNG
jgi:hypothetical protein